MGVPHAPSLLVVIVRVDPVLLVVDVVVFSVAFILLSDVGHALSAPRGGRRGRRDAPHERDGRDVVLEVRRGSYDHVVLRPGGRGGHARLGGARRRARAVGPGRHLARGRDERELPAPPPALARPRVARRPRLPARELLRVRPRGLRLGGRSAYPRVARRGALLLLRPPARPRRPGGFPPG